MALYVLCGERGKQLDKQIALRCVERYHWLVVERMINNWHCAVRRER